MACINVTIHQNRGCSVLASLPADPCHGDALILTASLGVSYLWSDGSTTSDITITTSGTYCVTITDQFGCTCVACDLFIVPHIDLPQCSIYSSSTTICDGQQLTLDAGAWDSYLWDNGSTDQTNIITSPGHYCVTITGLYGCSCVACIDIMANPIIPITCNGTNLLCNGDHSGTVGVEVQNATIVYNYNWSNGSTDAHQTGLAAGIYCVTVTDANGCTASCCITITEPPALVVSCRSNLLPCGDLSGKVCVDVSGGTPGYTYQWSINNNIMTINTPCISVSSAGTYCVTVTDVNGCTATCCVTVTQSIPLSVNCSATTLSCKNPTPTICVSVTGGTPSYSYLWSNGATTACQNVSQAGTYCVTVTDKKGCTATCCLKVDKYIPVTANCSGTNPACAATNTGSACVSATGGTPTYTYLWSNGGTASCILNLTAGTYCVTVTDKFGCSTTCCTTIKDPLPAQSPIISANGPLSFCPGGSVTLSVPATYSSYIWSNGGTISSITVSNAGTYIVTVTNSNGCTSTAQKTVTVLAAPMPVINATGLSTYCSGTTSVTLTVGVFASYIWNTGATTQTIVILPGFPGTYTVTVTSTNGCTGTASILVDNGCNAPTSLTTTNIAPTTAMANWVQAACCVSYTIELLDVNNNATLYNLACNTHFTFSGLQRGKLYCWRIRTNCNQQMTVFSAWTPYVCFRTLPRLMGDETAKAPESFNVYPNPNNGNFTIEFNAESATNYNLKLVDVIGQVIVNNDIHSEVGDNQYKLNLDNIAKGVYLLILQNSEGTLQKKIIIE